MLDETVRTRFASLATPAARRLAAWGVTPALVTWLGFAVALAAAGAVALGWPRVGLALWLVNRVADGLDGVLARGTRRDTAFGGYLDITLDMASYCAMVMGFALAHPDLAVMWQAVMFGYVLAITTTLALASAAERARQSVSSTNRSIQFTTGIAEASETTLVYAAWALVPEAIGPVGWTWVVLLAATAVQRSLFAARHLR